MCGIIGYVGKKQALPIVMEGLKRLEYRGYDSAGVVVLNKGAEVVKTKGGIEDLREKLTDIQGTTAIGHNRWATHGEPSDIKNNNPG